MSTDTDTRDEFDEFDAADRVDEADLGDVEDLAASHGDIYAQVIDSNVGRAYEYLYVLPPLLPAVEAAVQVAARHIGRRIVAFEIPDDGTPGAKSQLDRVASQQAAALAYRLEEVAAQVDSVKADEAERLPPVAATLQSRTAQRADGSRVRVYVVRVDDPAGQ